MANPGHPNDPGRASPPALMARETIRARNTEWDPILLVSQIVALQALHYLTLAILVPPSLILFSEPKSLQYEGGPWNVGMIMDWREMAGRPTVHGLHGSQHRGWALFEQMSSGSKNWSSVHSQDDLVRSYGIDPVRGWVISAIWLIASCADVYYIYFIIRRPKLVLDFSLTLVLNHIILTTYYSAALPSSLFFGGIMAFGAVIKTVLGEHMCVKREMREGIPVFSTQEERAQLEDMELGTLRPD